MSHRIAPHALAILLSAAGLVPGRRELRAQQAARTIPVELAAAYVRTLGRSDSASTVEFMPGDEPAAVRDILPVPPGARIIGTVLANRVTTVLASSTQPPDSVVAWYAAQYAKRGLPGVSLVRTQAFPPGVGGFRQPPPAHPTQFCNDADEIDVGATRSPDGWTEVRVRLSPSAPVCRLVPAAQRRPQPTTAVNLPLPVVYDPPNTTLRPECFLDDARQQSQTRVFTDMSPDSLLRHYGRQLETSGWTRVAGDSLIAVGLWTRRDSTGALQTAKLTVAGALGTAACKNATLEVSTMRGR